MTRLELLAVLCRDLDATSRRLDEARLVAEFLRDLDAVLAAHDGRTALEYKYDGARIQLHRAGDRVAVWTRGLADVTASLPDVVEIARRDLTGAPFVLDGEVVALDAPASGGGRP